MNSVNLAQNITLVFEEKAIPSKDKMRYSFKLTRKDK